MKRKFFGTDGIRGKVGQTPITADFALKLGHAIGRVLEEEDKRSLVLIGKDTRISGYMLESALESGLISAGADVLLLGPIPTPAVAYLVRAQRASLGIVISASHNPYDDNGIKFFSSRGTKLPDSWEQKVEALVEQSPVWADSEHLGRAKRMEDASGRYIEFCKSTFDKELSLKGLRIVVDAANGAAYQVAPAVFHELGAEVIKMGCTPDGLNINADCGATHPESLIAKVKETRADFGVALDGDADRLLLVDSLGRVFNGDELLYAMARARMEQDESLTGVVGTLMTNMAIEVALKKRGVQLIRAKVGDRYVLEELEKKGWVLGGEGSGHLLALDKHTTGDGLISALQILQLVVRSEKPLAHWLDDASLFPQTLINVRVPAGSDWSTNAALVALREDVEKILGDRGRVLIRASGTEPVVRVMVEAEDSVQCKTLAQRLAHALEE